MLANLVPSLRDIGYMEACMDWFLIYREHGDMVDLCEQIDKSQIDEIRIWSEESKNVLFVEISKL